MGGLDGPQYVITAEICNDTGSNVQTIFAHDWNTMNPFNIPIDTLSVTEASGRSQQLPTFIGEIRIFQWDQQNNMRLLTPWLSEAFIVKPWSPTTSLLSGAAMRRALYFATAPGNQYLYVSAKKSGIVSQLPIL